MKLGIFTKQPAERESYTIDYSEDLTAGDNVASATAVVTPAGLLIEQVVVADPKVRAWISGGSVGVTYKVTFTVNTEDNRILQDEFTIKIKEI